MNDTAKSPPSLTKKNFFAASLVNSKINAKYYAKHIKVNLYKLRGAVEICFDAVNQQDIDVVPLVQLNKCRVGNDECSILTECWWIFHIYLANFLIVNNKSLTKPSCAPCQYSFQS